MKFKKVQVWLEVDEDFTQSAGTSDLLSSPLIFINAILIFFNTVLVLSQVYLEIMVSNSALYQCSITIHTNIMTLFLNEPISICSFAGVRAKYLPSL